MADLVDIEAVKDRLDWELDEGELRMAAAACEDASDLARHYAQKDWDDPERVPRMARTLALRAVTRYMRNPDGYTQSRAGDETLTWNQDAAGAEAGTVYFTRAEQDVLAGMGGRAPGLVSVATTAWRTRNWQRPSEGFVPVVDSTEKPFPFLASDDGPW